MQAEGGVRRGVLAIAEPVDSDPDAADLACEVRGVTKSFGAVAAVDDVDLSIERGSLTCLIGPNGAGKSTLLGCISGLLRVDAGQRRRRGARGDPLDGASPTSAGLATVFQTTPRSRTSTCSGTRWSDATRGHAPGFVEAMLRVPWQRGEERRIEEEAHGALELVGLDDRAADPAGSLPLGQLRLLAVARALAQRPRLLLLDEPAAGPAQREKARLARPCSR